MLRTLLNQVTAMAGGGGGGAGGGESAWGMFIPIVLMFAIIYFLMIRPQQKQAKKHKEMLGALKRGDQVVTNGGILGRVFQLNEGIVTLEVADNVKIKVLKSQITALIANEGELDKKQGG